VTIHDHAVPAGQIHLRDNLTGRHGLFSCYKPVVFAFHGYKEQGTTTAPIRQAMTDARARHRTWIVEHGEDLPEIREWTWTP
jgi:phosphoketolase